MGEHRQWRQGLRRINRPGWLHPPRWTRIQWLVWTVFAVAALSMFALTLAIIAVIQSNHRVDVKTAQVNAAVGAATSANASLSAAGLPTVQVPTSAAAPTATVTITGPQGSAGNTGPGPTDAQVAAAVVAFCEFHSCSSPPTSSDVASAVAAYCASHSGCVGPAGPQGASGKDATTDQIAASVQAYCAANNACQGPAGVQGPPGATGPEIPSFTFTIHGALGDTTYICSAPDYQCQAQ